MIDDYIKTIIQLLAKCKDLSLLDLILKILQKSLK